MSLSHGEKFSRVHSPSAMWVQSVTTRGFKVCTRETGFGTNGTGVVNWLAFQTHPQIIQGAVTIDGVWTTQTKCNKVAFKQVSKYLIHRPLRFLLSERSSSFVFWEVKLENSKNGS